VGEAYFLHMLNSATLVIPPTLTSELAEFVYDADGNRVKKTYNGVTTIYVGELYEKTGSLITKHIYLGTNRIASKTSTDTLYYHSDHLGSSNVVTNVSGQQVQLSEYKPYGELSLNTANNINYYFTGKELDPTGLYYYGARYYDPRVGRFITVDPLKQNILDISELNPYAYCSNNPLRYIDPTGNYKLDFNLDDILPGDIALQRAGTNIISSFALLVGESYAHGFIVLEVYRDESGDIVGIRRGELLTDPENQRILSNTKFSYPFGIKIWEPGFASERIQDYDFYRVTNSPTEAALAVARAESPNAWDFEMDPSTLIWGPITGKDYYQPFDSKMICIEYLNFLYDYKFNNPLNGVTLPSDIVNYQEIITRPSGDYTMHLDAWEDFITDFGYY